MMIKSRRLLGSLLAAVLLAALVPATGWAEETDSPFCPKNTDGVEAALYELYRASTYADIEAIDRLISRSPNPVFIGTDPSEVFTGHDEIVQWWQGIFDFLADFGYPNNGGLPLVPTGDPVQVQRRGSTAWVVDEPNFEFLNGSVPTRLTLVLRREHGKWRIIQGHFSVGVPDMDVPL